MLTPSSSEETAYSPASSTPTITPITQPVDVGIVIALPEEFRVLQQEVGAWRSIPSTSAPGQSYYAFEQPGPDGTPPYRCLATFIGDMGPTPAALTTSHLLNEHKPATVVMLGIAGALDSDLRVGDVVLAKSSDLYQARAKATAPAPTHTPTPTRRTAVKARAQAVRDASPQAFRFQLSGEVYRCSKELVNLGQHLEFSYPDVFAQWRREAGEQLVVKVAKTKLPRLLKNDLIRDEPRLEVGAIACGNTVGAHAAFGAWLKERNRSYAALEMESGGLLAAVHEKADLSRTLVLRGISDYGDERKAELDRIGDGVLRSVAMRNAVHLLWALFRVGAFQRK